MKTLAKQANALNTLNGGVTATNVELREESNRYVARFYNIALKEENYHVEINNNSLTVYATLPESSDLDAESQEKKLIIPCYIQTFPIPAFIDVSKIEARFEDDSLYVIAPFKEGFNQRPRKLDIKKPG